jgi:poly(A) polymerase
MTLCEADLTTRNEKKKKRFLLKYQMVRKMLVEVEEKDRLRNFQPPVDGQEIMDLFGLKPSKEIGVLKTAVKDAILDGEIKNDRTQALAFLFAKAQEMGLQPKKDHEH